MNYDLIRYDVRDMAVYITLKREPLNVLNIAMMREINHALDRAAEESGLTALVFRSEGKAFSAGVDVGEHLGDQVHGMIDAFHGIFRRMDKLGLVSIAGVNGAALGGGFELALYCDMIVASTRAVFGQPEIKVGVFPPIAALVMPRTMSRKKTMELILTGELVSARQAKALGLVNQVVNPNDLDKALEALVGRLRKLSPLVLRVTRKAIRVGLMDRAEEALDAIEKIYLEELMTSKDADEGLRAFMAKRHPNWANK